GGSVLGLFEINEAAQLVSNSAAVDANIIFGAVIDDALGDEVRVTVIAAGLDQERTGRGVGRDGEVGAGSGGADIGGSSFNRASPAPAPAPTPAPAPRPAPIAPPSPATQETGPARSGSGEASGDGQLAAS